MADPQVKTLETADDIKQRREQVLNRYVQFKEAARERRSKLEDARRFQQFRRDADELEAWINEKLQTASDESYKDTSNLQVCQSGRCLRATTGVDVAFYANGRAGAADSVPKR